MFIKLNMDLNNTITIILKQNKTNKMEKEQMKLTGRVQTIFNTQVISEKFRKREIVLNTGGEYAQQIIFQFTNDSCEALEGLNEGDQIDVYLATCDSAPS